MTLEDQMLSIEELKTKTVFEIKSYAKKNNIDLKNAKTKVEIICKRCNNVFLQSPIMHIRGNGCPECGKVQSALSQTFTCEEFIEKASKIHNSKYNYNKVFFYGQPIALIVADTLENANAAVRLVKAEYEAHPFDTDFDKARLVPEKLKPAVEVKRGEVGKYKQAATFIESEYNIPIEDGFVELDYIFSEKIYVISHDLFPYKRLYIRGTDYLVRKFISEMDSYIKKVEKTFIKVFSPTSKGYWDMICKNNRRDVDTVFIKNRDDIINDIDIEIIKCRRCNNNQ